jgi:putative peptide-modifying radical SAM enzyme
VNDVEPDYLKRFQTILVSLDGNEELTDHYRGKGNYRRVIDNLKRIRQRGFRGELIARMTVDEETRLDDAVKWLISNEEFPFTSIHWQLDAQFWRRDFNSERVERWFRRYNDEVSNLVSYWIEHMEKTGHVLRIYPLTGLMESLLREEKTKLRCGAGWIEFNIQPDGNITPCPVMAGMKEFYLGNIRESAPKDLADSIFVKNLCNECTILDVCGGRCLYANATMLWKEEGYKAVCGTVSNLIESLQHCLPKIRLMMRRGELKLQDFEYEKYNSCEIIP